MFDLKAYLERQRQTVNASLIVCIEAVCVSESMRQPMEYALMAGGKRLRPILCLAANAAVGGDEKEALPAACALEMIHTYSLIHDDLPALDNDNLRRGKPTCHVQFGEAIAILTGDGLLTGAFQLLAQKGLSCRRERLQSYLRTVQLIAEAAGCRGMIEGQCRDLAFEGIKLDQNQLQELHALKTGALIRASVQCGAVLGNATESQLSALTTYSQLIGLAFQVTDDILNVSGDPQKLGKAVGTDQARHKNTYPALLGLEQSRTYARSLVDEALQLLSIFDKGADPLRAVAEYIVERNR